MSQNILVTGGAGYIGSHTCLALSDAGFTPVVYDDLSNGHAEFVQWGPLEQGDIRDSARLDFVFAKYKPAAVMHFAALIEVGESVKSPSRFYDVNVGGALSLIAAAQRAGLDKFVFSSTCATYGAPIHVPMDESHPQRPLNPYGWSKLMVERVLLDLDRYGTFRSAILRYFNAAGADPEGRIGEWHNPETHAVPLAIEAALGRRAGFKLFGADYDTRDGTCIRDYVHVLDLADGHVRALERLLNDGSTEIFNLGTGDGTTVRELIRAVEHASGGFEVAEAPRREGDAPVLVANAAKAKSILGWMPSRSLEEIVNSATAWHRGRNS